MLIKQEFVMGKKILEYCERYSQCLPFYLRSWSEKSQAWRKDYEKMIGVEQGCLLMMLVKSMQAERVLDIGTFTGMSALCMAEGLLRTKKIRSCKKEVILVCDTLEKDKEIYSWIKEAIKETPVRDIVQPWLMKDAQEVIEFVKGRGLDKTLKYDVVFMDADKKNYIQYYEAIMNGRVMKEHGILLVDNSLYRGLVVNENVELKNTAHYVHNFNEHVAKDERAIQVIMPMFDGLTMIQYA